LIFLDTSAIIALSNRLDERHVEARALVNTLSGPAELLTHNYVVVEAFSLLHRRHGLKVASRFAEESSAFDVVWVDRQLHEAAARSLARKGTKRSSLVDEVSFLVMRSRGIDTAFAFDSDFEREGFKTLG